MRMNVMCLMKISVIASLIVFASCSKENENNLNIPSTPSTPSSPNNPNNSTPLTTSTQKFVGSGNVSFTGSIAAPGITEITCNWAGAKYHELSDSDANTNRAELLFANIPTNAGLVVTFSFDGKNYPTIGTYQVAEFATVNGQVNPGKVVVNVGTNFSKSTDNQSIQVVNNNGEITITASGIKLYSSLTGDYEGSIENINLTKTNTPF